MSVLTGGTAINTLNGGGFTRGGVTLFGGANNDGLTGTGLNDSLASGGANDCSEKSLSVMRTR